MELCEDAKSYFINRCDHQVAMFVKVLEDGCRKGKHESPIEQKLYAELLHLYIFDAGYIAELKPQVQEGPYRIDIAVTLKLDNNFYRVAIECDGHDFHEKTEEQASRDKKKDRYLQSRGWLVARFTGKQINNNPAGCYKEVFEMVSEINSNKKMRGEGIERGLD